MTDTVESTVERATAYLAGGGLFNPELANHDAVRDLIIDLRAAVERVVQDKQRLAQDCMAADERAEEELRYFEGMAKTFEAERDALKELLLEAREHMKYHGIAEGLRALIDEATK